MRLIPCPFAPPLSGKACFGLMQLLALTLVVFSNSALAITAPIRLSAAPGYQGRASSCPARCATSGPNPGNWSLYHNLDQFSSCQESLFYSFSFLDPVDDADTAHHIYACTSFGPDWANLPSNQTSLDAQAQTHSGLGSLANGTYELGYWPSSSGTAIATSLATLSRQLSQYLSNGFGTTTRSTVLFASYGPTSVGLYIGKGLQNKGIADNALAYLERSLAKPSFAAAATIAMQFCHDGQNSDHIFGLIGTGNATFSAVQETLQSWSKARCLSIPAAQNITGVVPLVSPLYTPGANTTATNTTIYSMSKSKSKSKNKSNSSSNSNSTSVTRRKTKGRLLDYLTRRTVAPRASCTTISVNSGDGCASLAQRCNITPAQFTQYNSEANECSTLQPGELVCCSAGSLPDNTPQPQADGTCATYTVQPGDDCSMIAASHSITQDQLLSFNNNTWGWVGCNPLYSGSIICLSSGNPPMPAPVANAICGPQVPGTPTPPAGTNISTLNECPLNACCDKWGQVSSSLLALSWYNSALRRKP